jgi:hypothetical protein
MEAHPDILDRNLSKKAAQPITGPLCSVLQEIVNYGTMAHVRCHSTFSVAEEHLVILFSHYQIIEMLDAVEVMLQESVCFPIRLQLRACFENLLYMDYVLKGDSDTKGLCYVFVEIK